jgi:uncharacterized protein YpmB
VKYVFIVISVFVLLIGWQFAHVTVALFSEKNTWETAGIELAKSQTGILHIDEVTQYHGEDSYLIVQGKSEQGVAMIAWFQNEKLIHFQYASDTTDKETITEKVFLAEGAIELKALRPALGQQKPLWEVVFIDEEGQYNYQYYDMLSGEFVRSYRLQKEIS